MQMKIWWAMVVLASSVACSPRLYVPEGNAEAGRRVFASLECHHCHSVQGEDFPAPAVTPPVPVVLGSPLDKKSRVYLAESIIAPSHRFAKPRPTIVYGHPPIIEEREYENIKEDTESRMGDFNDVMTVREWIDLVAYLEFAQNRMPQEASRE